MNGNVKTYGRKMWVQETQSDQIPTIKDDLKIKP